MPIEKQWARYEGRFEELKLPRQKFVAMSDCTQEYANIHLPKFYITQTNRLIPISYIGWRDIESMTHSLGQSHAEKRLLLELSLYLKRVATMQNNESNLVYVVSIGSGFPEGGEISWRDIVEKKKIYFHPVGNGWPKEPPNYIAFRYDGQLQSIHHIDSYLVSTDAGDIEGLPKHWDWTLTGNPKEYGGGPHFIYSLGPKITSTKTIKTGNKIVMSNRVTIMLDLLLTSETISEAFVKTKQRLGKSLVDVDIAA